MAIDVDDLRIEVNTTAADDDVLANSVAVADALLIALVDDDVLKATIPEVIYDRAWLAVAVEVFNQRKSPNGVLNQPVYDASGNPIASGAPRPNGDPLRPAYPLLKRFLGTGVA